MSSKYSSCVVQVGSRKIKYLTHTARGVCFYDITQQTLMSLVRLDLTIAEMG